MIHVLLGVLYESCIHPIAILVGLPSPAVGALATLMLFGLDLTLIAMIGILLVIVVVKKNAIRRAAAPGHGARAGRDALHHASDLPGPGPLQWAPAAADGRSNSRHLEGRVNRTGRLQAGAHRLHQRRR